MRKVWWKNAGRWYLVTLSLTADDVFCRNFEVVKVECACGRSSNAKFLFLFGNLNTHILGSNKASYSFVAFTWVNLYIQISRSVWMVDLNEKGIETHVCEDQENFGLIGIGNPHFGTIDDPVVAILLGTGLKGEGVGTRCGFR